MFVKELMSKAVASCAPSDTLNRAAQLMWNCDCGCIPVVDEGGKPISMITDRDICMAAYTRDLPLSMMKVDSAMSQRIITAKEMDTISDAEAMMREQQIRRLPVVDDAGKVTGVLSLNDIAVHSKSKLGRLGHRNELGADAVASTLAAICAPAQLHAAE